MATQRDAAARSVIASSPTPGTREVEPVVIPNAQIDERSNSVVAPSLVHEQTEPTVELRPADRSNITETGMMLYYANDSHGQRDKEYRFNFRKVDGGWRAYILRMPSLENRSSDAAIIHRLHDNDGFYVCWDRNVDTLKDMQAIARIWADSIQGYIYTGRFGA